MYSSDIDIQVSVFHQCSEGGTRKIFAGSVEPLASSMGGHRCPVETLALIHAYWCPFWGPSMGAHEYSNPALAESPVCDVSENCRRLTLKTREVFENSWS